MLVVVAEITDIGKIQLIRESRLDRTRPDFAALHTLKKKHDQKGYVELKAQDISVDAPRWVGRNAKQWDIMKREAEVLIVCNGRHARRF